MKSGEQKRKKMKLSRLFILIVIFYLGTNFSNAQCEEQNQQRILLIGDSWAFFMGVDQTINTVMEHWGHSNIKFYTNTELAQNGARTHHFLQPEKQEAMLQAFADFPDADHVHLSIGGNDFLGNWKMSYTEEETEVLKQQVINQLVQIIDFILDNKPGVKILWSGYVYTNFQEEIERFLIPTEHPFYSTWSNMEYPDNESLNHQSINFMEGVRDALIAYEDVYYVHAPGLMQYHFGQTNPLEVAPFGTYQPQTAELPNGYIEYPSPRNSMRDYGITKDCFHLSARGYRIMLGYQTQKYYHKAFMNDSYYLAKGEGTSGTIYSDQTTSSELMVGQNNGVDAHTVVHFELNNLPDTSIQAARLFFHQKTEFGTNPFEGTVTVRMKENYFGSDPAVASDDLLDLPTAQANVCVFGSAKEGRWVRLDLPAPFLQALRNQSNVSFIISSDTDGSVELSGTDDPDFAPVLDLTFNDETLALETSEKKPEITVFPNPTKNVITIHSDQTVQHIKVLDIQGKVVAEPKNTSTINLSGQKEGMYFIQVHTANQITLVKVVRI